MPMYDVEQFEVRRVHYTWKPKMRPILSAGFLR